MLLSCTGQYRSTEKDNESFFECTGTSVEIIFLAEMVRNENWFDHIKKRFLRVSSFQEARNKISLIFKKVLDTPVEILHILIDNNTKRTQTSCNDSL